MPLAVRGRVGGGKTRDGGVEAALRLDEFIDERADGIGRGWHWGIDPMWVWTI
jgi:hypothetical protein